MSMNYHARLQDGIAHSENDPEWNPEPWDEEANVDEVRGVGVYGTASLEWLRDEIGLPMEGFVGNDAAALGGASGVAAQNK